MGIVALGLAIFAAALAAADELNLFALRARIALQLVCNSFSIIIPTRPLGEIFASSSVPYAQQDQFNSCLVTEQQKRG